MDEIEKYCTAALGLEVETEGAIKNISDLLLNQLLIH